MWTKRLRVGETWWSMSTPVFYRQQQLRGIAEADSAGLRSQADSAADSIL
jgi:hypothetical protein